jgi:hypothetical protein
MCPNERRWGRLFILQSKMKQKCDCYKEITKKIGSERGSGVRFTRVEYCSGDFWFQVRRVKGFFQRKGGDEESAKWKIRTKNLEIRNPYPSHDSAALRDYQESSHILGEMKQKSSDALRLEGRVSRIM